MNILVVNDDGIDAKGIHILAEKLKSFGKVYVIAPHTEQSGMGHGITIHKPMVLHEHGSFMSDVVAWSLEAKPADCVKFALYGLQLDIDLICSGVNDGPNLGTDIIYSGTLAGASEAIICGKPAVAVSTDFGNFSIVEDELGETLEAVFNNQITSLDHVININFPKQEHKKSKGIRVTETGDRPFLHDYVQEDGAYWARGTWDTIINGPDTDVTAWEQGYISITPIQINRTNFKKIDEIRRKLNLPPQSR